MLPVSYRELHRRVERIRIAILKQRDEPWILNPACDIDYDILHGVLTNARWFSGGGLSEKRRRGLSFHLLLGEPSRAQQMRRQNSLLPGSRLPKLPMSRL